MANLSKERRDRMIAKLEELKVAHSDDASIAALNEIENALREKKYGLVWEEHSEEVDELLADNIPILTADPERRLCKDSSLPWNFIIEGDNLQALYLLEKTHHGKVDCIYIDPPYNTGARDWKYNNDYVDGNDDYRHSKWLSMMKSRLTLAKKLLNPTDSVLIVTIDEKEYLHLGCLLKELFPESDIQMISSVINPKGSAREGRFSRVDEYLFFVFLGNNKVIPGQSDMLRDMDDSAERTVRWASLMRNGKPGARTRIPSLFYPVFINKQNGRFHSVGEPLAPEASRHDVVCPEGTIALFPINSAGIEQQWSLFPPRFLEYYEKGYIRFGKYDGKEYRTIYYLQDGMIKKINNGDIVVAGKDDEGSLILSYKDGLGTKKPSTIWHQTSHSASEFGTTLLNRILGVGRFTYPKSIYAVRDSVKFILTNKPNATIVDFFAGSGTTMHAVNLLNAEDGGHRRCIMVTNNEVSEAEQKDFESRGIHKGDKEWEERGIAKYVTWPRTVCAINGVNVNGEPLKGNYIGSDIPMSDGFKANVKYFKCDWTPRKPEEYLLSNALCLHIKELIELQTAQEVDNVKNVLLLTKDDYVKTVGNPEVFQHIENVWVNQNIMFNASELRMLKKLNFKYIPKEFFSQELREVGEYV